MEVDFVSEVDRKFFANNMLSSEDIEAAMDLTDMINFDSNLTTEDLVNHLPDELELPFDGDEFNFFDTVKQHDLVHEWSDSSDSGLSGMLGRESSVDGVKSEPLSPATSNHSDSCDSVISQVHDPCQTPFLSDTVKLEEPSLSSCDIIDLTQPQSQNIIYTIQHEEPKQTLSPVKEDPVKLQSILNSKIKIQPKPGSVPNSQTVPSSTTVLSSSICSSGNSQQKSIVLTAEEFTRLANQGVLRFDQPKPEPVAPVIRPPIVPSPPMTVASPVVSHPAQVTSPSVPVFSSHKLNIDDSDDNKYWQIKSSAADRFKQFGPRTGPTEHLYSVPVKTMKRQQRMIKNRESASLSRRKKKEYLSQLEVRLNQFNSENERLKEENQSLKRKLDLLVSENETLKKKVSFTPVKKTAFLAVVFMLSLNLAPWSSILPNDRPSLKDQLSRPLVHTGRQLMSVQEEPAEERWETTNYIHKLHSLILEYGGAAGMKDNITELPFLNMCPTYFNKTESLRLAEQLAGWMSRHQERRKTEKKPDRQKEKELRPISTLKRAMRGDMRVPRNKYMRPQDYQVQLYNGPEFNRDFLQSIHRRNDTFYVLSFDTDYWLVPAVAHNKTMRPRMSLVMPALALNESMAPPAGRVGMMQIDCEVMNTQLIHVQKSAMPKRENENKNQSNFGQGDY